MGESATDMHVNEDSYILINDLIELAIVPHTPPHEQLVCDWSDLVVKDGECVWNDRRCEIPFNIGNLNL